MRTPLLGVVATLAVAAAAGPALAQSRESPEPGLVIERVRASRPSTAPAGDGVITIVRVDPARFAFRFLSERRDGRRRPLPAWVRDQGLIGGINAGMFLPDGRSVGFMMDRGAVLSDRRPGRFTAAVGFGPSGPLPAVAVGGDGCPHGLDWIRERYSSVIQARALLVDCGGRALPWPHRRRYSAAALGMDRDGWAVLVHSRTPFRMTDLAEMLAEPSLGIRGLAYMEGGPEASLVVESGPRPVRLVGSWEDGFNPSDGNAAFWDLPNVVGFARRP